MSGVRIEMDKGLQLLATSEAALQEVQDLWRLPSGYSDIVKRTVSQTRSKHGLFANVPIICKGERCPYLGTCSVDILNLPKGYRCPIEIGSIMARFEWYCQEFRVSEVDAVDLGQIKQLVDLEIMIMRCESNMALSADFIEETIKDLTKNGTPIYEKNITKANEFKITLMERHSKILKDLNATRSSKKETGPTDDASKAASIIMKRINDIAVQNGSSKQEVLEANYYDDSCNGIVIDEEELIADYVVEESGDE